MTDEEIASSLLLDLDKIQAEKHLNPEDGYDAVTESELMKRAIIDAIKRAQSEESDCLRQALQQLIDAGDDLAVKLFEENSVMVTDQFASATMKAIDAARKQRQ